MKIGYFLSSEEYTSAELVQQAQLAERAGFDALWISDHFRPWNDAQGRGRSPFVWRVQLHDARCGPDRRVPVGGRAGDAVTTADVNRQPTRTIVGRLRGRPERNQG